MDEAKANSGAGLEPKAQGMSSNQLPSRQRVRRLPTSDLSESVDIDKVNATIFRKQLLAPSPTAQICIGGKMVNCILDMGAENSLISSGFYHQQIKQSVGNLGDGAFINLRGANNLEIPVKGYLRTQIIVLGRKFIASFLVRTSVNEVIPSESVKKIHCGVVGLLVSLADILLAAKAEWRM